MEQAAILLHFVYKLFNKLLASGDERRLFLWAQLRDQVEISMVVTTPKFGTLFRLFYTPKNDGIIF